MNVKTCASSTEVREKQRSVKACASPNISKSWEDINIKLAEAHVKKLQNRIAKAYSAGEFNKVKYLQHHLTKSIDAKILAVNTVTKKKGGKTPGIDGVVWKTSDDKWKAVKQLSRYSYNPQPLRRVYIRKSNRTKRPISIPTMLDRTMQTLYEFSVEPIEEITGDPNSYGFRTGRCTQDAIMQCRNIFSKPDSHQWILEGDIKGCFDNIKHE